MNNLQDTLHLEWTPGRFAVCRLDPGASIPAWAATSPTPAASSPAAALVSITRTEDELSIVAEETNVPADAPADVERGWSAMRVAGQLDFALVGILAKLTGALAGAGIPCFAISTYDTDYLLVKATDAARAAAALRTVAVVADPT